MVTSPSRRFVVIGEDDRENLDLMTWAETVASRVERLLGLEFAPAAGEQVRIVVGGPDEGAQRDRVGLSRVGSGFALRVGIPDYDRADVEEANQVLCEAVLAVIQRRRRSGPVRPASAEGAAQAVMQTGLPRWLCVGLAENLYSSDREENSEAVLRQWEEGKLRALADFLASGAGEASSSVRSADSGWAATAGLFAAWLSDMPNRGERFGRILDRLADGMRVDASWLATCIPECKTPSDAEKTWDEWLLRRRRVVQRPGVATPRFVEQFRAELLLRPGDSGIPLTSGLSRGLGFRDLVALKQSPWIGGFVRSRSAGLRLCAVGRGDEAGSVAAAYCEFLAALGRRESDAVLNRFLDAAEERLQRLDRGIRNRECQGGANDGADRRASTNRVRFAGER